MVNKPNNTTVREIKSTQPVITEFASAHRSQHSKKNNADDIIVSLAEAYENKRARQVVEWVRQQHVRKAT